MDHVSASTLPPLDRSSFATSSRLLSCLVTESLLRGIFVPAGDFPEKQLFIGIAIILAVGTTQCNSLDDIFAIVPLRHVPIFKPRSRDEIGLLDPQDMLPFVYELDSVSLQQNAYAESLPWQPQLLAALSRAPFKFEFGSLILTRGPLYLWKKFANQYDVDERLQEAIIEELQSSIAWQQHAYQHPPLVPTFDSPSIAWEQCIVEGHPIHPMHKARRAVFPIAPVQPGDFDWQHPLISLCAFPRASLHIQGAWDDYLAPLCEAAAIKAKMPIDIPEGYTIIPLHALQVANVREKFPEAYILPEEYHVEALAQQSLRSVIVPSVLPSLNLKLSMGVRLTSVMRTISPPMGPSFSGSIIPRLTYDRDILIMQQELASVVHIHPDPDIAKHLAGIVREGYENTSVEAHGERVIVCTALVETCYGGEGELPLVQLTFGLNTEEKRITWLDTFVEIYFKAFLPSVITNGVAFEVHPQNTLARFDIQTRKLKGFVIRDFCGVQIHPPTLIASTDLTTLDGIIPPEHTILADSLDGVYTRLYNTLINNHLQRLIRVLDLHYNGIGWDIVRRHLSEEIPEGHQLRKLWLSEDSEMLPGHYFICTRLQDSDRVYMITPIPNLLHYKGTGDLTGG